MRCRHGHRPVAECEQISSQKNDGLRRSAIAREVLGNDGQCACERYRHQVTACGVYGHNSAGLRGLRQTDGISDTRAKGERRRGGCDGVEREGCSGDGSRLRIARGVGLGGGDDDGAIAKGDKIDGEQNDGLCGTGSGDGLGDDAAGACERDEDRGNEFAADGDDAGGLRGLCLGTAVGDTSAERQCRRGWRNGVEDEADGSGRRGVAGDIGCNSGDVDGAIAERDEFAGGEHDGLAGTGSGEGLGDGAAGACEGDGDDSVQFAGDGDDTRHLRGLCRGNAVGDAGSEGEHRRIRCDGVEREGGGGGGSRLRIARGIGLDGGDGHESVSKGRQIGGQEHDGLGGAYAGEWLGDDAAGAGEGDGDRGVEFTVDGDDARGLRGLDQ